MSYGLFWVLVIVGFLIYLASQHPTGALLVVSVIVTVIGYFIWQNEARLREKKKRADKADSDCRVREAEAAARDHAELSAEIDRQKANQRNHFDWSSIEQFDQRNSDQVLAATHVVAVCEGIPEYLRMPGVNESELCGLTVSFPACGPAKYDYTKTVVSYNGQIVAEKYFDSFYTFRPGRWIEIVWELEPKVAAVKALRERKAEVGARAQQAARFGRFD